jgi:hypothetical protein
METLSEECLVLDENRTRYRYLGGYVRSDEFASRVNRDEHRSSLF